MPKVGFLRQTSSIGWDLRYAHKEAIPDGGGERIVVATDRPIGNWEAFNQPRTIDYPFTVIELHIKANGEGEGKMTYATKLTRTRRRDRLCSKTGESARFCSKVSTAKRRRVEAADSQTESAATEVP